MTDERNATLAALERIASTADRHHIESVSREQAGSPGDAAAVARIGLLQAGAAARAAHVALARARAGGEDGGQGGEARAEGAENGSELEGEHVAAEDYRRAVAAIYRARNLVVEAMHVGSPAALLAVLERCIRVLDGADDDPAEGG